MKNHPIYSLLALLLFAALPQQFAWANSAPPEEAGEPAPKLSLVKLKPLIVPILKGNRVVKYIVIKINLEPAPEVDAQAVTHDLPRVNDALLREIYLYARENSGAGDVDLEALRARLLPVINAALGDKKIIALYYAGADTLKI